jgi:hypothetical protein
VKKFYSDKAMPARNAYRILSKNYSWKGWGVLSIESKLILKWILRNMF